MKKTAVSSLFLLLLAAALILSACGIMFEGGNLKIKDNGEDIVSIGADGFMLDGNLTGLILDTGGLRIEYPNGSLVWGGEGLDIKHKSGNIRIAGGQMTVTDKDGKQKVLDTTGQGAEYRTDGGVLVRTGKKASLPEDYPKETVPLMDGFELDAAAILGSVRIVSGHVKGSTVEDAAVFYEPLLNKGSSFSRETKENSVLLRAKLDGTDVTVYIYRLLSADTVNVSIVIGK